MDVVRPHNEIDVRGLSQELVSFLLGQATTDPDQRSRAFFLQRPEPAQLAHRLLDRLFPYAACVDQDHVRRSFIRGTLVSEAS